MTDELINKIHDIKNMLDGALAHVNELDEREQILQKREVAFVERERQLVNRENTINLKDKDFAQRENYLTTIEKNITLLSAKIAAEQEKLKQFIVLKEGIEKKLEELKQKEASINQKLAQIEQLGKLQEDIEQRERMIAKEKAVEEARKRLLDLREQNIINKEEQLERTSEMIRV